MINELNYYVVPESVQQETFGKGAELSVAMVTTFAVIAIVTIVIYKIYASKTGDITLPGGFKFKFTT